MSRSAAREWDAGTYHRVSSPQLGWGTAILEPLALRGDEIAVDEGCGTGRLTGLLLDRLPRGRVVGIDASIAMLDEARRHLAGAGDRFHPINADVVEVPLRDGVADLVFSTATYHWVADHDRLFAEVARLLRPGGRLVAQCGGAGNLDTAHAWALDLLADPRFAGHLQSWRTPWVFATPAQTAARLERAGLQVQTVELVPSPQTFAGRRELGEFLRTVVLRPFLGPLPDEATRGSFVEAVVDRAAAAEPALTLDYVRLNLEARRPVPARRRS